MDDSDCAKAALKEVIKLAADRPREVQLIHVIDSLHRNEALPEGSLGAIMQDTPRNEGHKLLEEARAILAREGIEATPVLVESSGRRPAVVINEHVRHWAADLIVMGTHGRRGVSRLVLGSEAAEVVGRALIPVLLVRDVKHG
jgi:nucleotide-binding universal stress UspA family protein